MSRVEENKELVEVMTDLAKEKPSGSFEEMTCFHLGTIATFLADISKSLAILADKAESEEEFTIHCKDCKSFEYDHVENVGGVPLIVGHEVCTKWGDGCKTNENGACFLAELKEAAAGEDNKN